MPLIPAPPAAPDKDTLALRVDRDLHAQLRDYAEFLNSTKEYIVSSALRRVFRHDKDFIAWQQARSTPPASTATTSSARTSTSNDPAEETARSTGSDAQRRAVSKERA